MSDNIEITLLPSGVGDKHTNANDDTCVSFNVKSDNIKVFPSSWRGVNFTRDGQGKIIPENAVVQFNPEATLNTEYNLTHSAGGIKTYIETLDEIDTTNHIFDLDFFLNGYHFEIFSLNLKYIYSSNLNLWACIRVDDLSIGDADLDDTKVLMPYYWNALNTPIPLDATLQDAYLIDETDKGFGDILDELQYKNGKDNIVTSSMSTNCIFTGLVLTTENPEADNSANIHTIQLFRNGQACYDNFYPRQVRSGRPDGKSTVIGDEGLIASYANMLAVGTFNAEDELTNGEKPLFVVGNGTDDAQRRNAFEVFGKTENGEFSQTVKFGNITFKHDSDVIGNVSDMSGLRNINNGIQVTEDGSSITVNRECKSNTDIGIHSYGNIDLRGPDSGSGSKLRFQDYDANDSSIIKTISDFQIVEVATGKSNVIDPDARGLKMTNIHEINEKALVFKPCNAGIDRNKLRSINDGSIGIDDDAMSKYQHSIEIGRNKQDESAALSLAGDKLVIKSEPGKGEFINNIRIEEQNSTGTDNLFNVAGIYNKNNTVAPAIYFDGDKIEIIPVDSDHDTGTKNSLGDNLRKILLDAIYPIGSIYMSMENRNPSQTLGGTWEQISQGRMLLGAGDWKTGNGDNDTISGESKSKLLEEILPNTFVTKAEGGQYSMQIPKHTHNVPIDYTISDSELETKSVTFTNTKVNSVEAEVTVKEHSHDILASNDSKHHHTIPTAYPSDNPSKYLTHPDSVANLTWNSAVDEDSTIYTKYTSNRGWGSSENGGDWSNHTLRYQKALINVLESSPIPCVSTAPWTSNNTHLCWNTKPENGVKTGYFGMADSNGTETGLYPWDDGFWGWYYTAKDINYCTPNDIWGNAFTCRVNRLFNTMFAVAFKYHKSYSGAGGGKTAVDEFANDNYVIRDRDSDCLFFYIPTKITYCMADDKTEDPTGKTDELTNYCDGKVATRTFNDIEFWKKKLEGYTQSNRFKVFEQVPVTVYDEQGNATGTTTNAVRSPIMAMYVYNTAPYDPKDINAEEHTSTLSKTIYVQFEYKKYNVGLCTYDDTQQSWIPVKLDGKHDTGHLYYHMTNHEDENEGVDKRLIYADFLRDFFDAASNSRMFYRPDGEHTHKCAVAEAYTLNHKHDINTNNFGHKHTLKDVELNFDTATSTTTMPSRYTSLPDVGSNLPPYLVCYMWKRIE